MNSWLTRIVTEIAQELSQERSINVKKQEKIGSR